MSAALAITVVKRRH